MGKFKWRKSWIEVGISVILLCLFLFLYSGIDRWVIQTLPSTVSPDYFPRVITVLCIVLSAMLVYFSIFALKTDFKNRVEVVKDEADLEEDDRIFPIICYISVLFIYIIGLYFVGFVYSTPFIMLFVAISLGLKRIFIGFTVYVLFAFGLNAVVFHLMHIILPVGVLFE